MMDHKLIVIEGLDGSGKATQSELLKDSLLDRGLHVRKVSFPNYESDSSAPIKMYLKGELGEHPDDVNAYAASSFYAVDRYCSYKKDWAEDYEKGIVIADRYTTSNAVHQCSKLPREHWDDYLAWLFEFEYKKLGIPSPDAVIYLRVDPIISQKLMSDRYDGNEEAKDIHEKDYNYLIKCREAADYCSSRLGWKIVDCCWEDQIRNIEDIRKEVEIIFQETI